jgi:hypothetical protein
MGHSISAIIAQAPINEPKAIERGLPVIFERAFVIVPIPWELLVELSRDDEPADDAATNIFNTHVPHLLARELGMAAYALIQTDYFGGVGEQNASLHATNGQAIRDITINTALRMLGVQRTPPYREDQVSDRRGGLLGKVRSWWAGRQSISSSQRSNMYPIKDEFDTLNLGEYRSMEDGRFWADGKAGQRVGNMLVGDRRILR